ncbi:hypothetical protein M0R45_037066 [Rubus argutus]|uniref:Uncharacterized protein n=1 Tax=Rubus argutus TaxID=59490 RepID=A0AAW1VY71_RUBAR
MNEVENLRCELEPLAVQNEVPKCKTNEKSSVDNFGHANLEKQRSSKAEEVMQELHEEEKKEEEGHFVSKMIKNHESIIRKKSVEAEELNILKREILQHKANLSSKREEDKFVKRRMQEVILRLDKLADWDAKLQELLVTLINIWEKMDKVPYGVNEELQNEGSILKQEQEESNLEDVIMKEIYVTLLEGLVNENYIKVYDNELESLMWKDICQVLFKEVFNQWKEKYEINNIESQTREEMHCTMYCTVLSEALKDYSSSCNIAFVESQELREWNKWKEDYETTCLLRQHVDQLVFHESIKDIIDTASYRLAQHQDIVARIFLQNTENFIKEDIYFVFVRETVEEWKMELSAFNMESHIREEIYKFVIVENVKDAVVLFREDADSTNEDKFSKGMLFANKFHNEKLVDLEHTTKEKLEMNFFRLDKMRHHLDELIELRCQDLRKAETEVDLLADQVDVLVGLLEKIYTTLYHHSPVLQQYFEVSDILQLIQKELSGVFYASKD